MHQYRLIIYAYTPEGAVGSYVTTLYADDPEKVRLYCRQYDGYQTVIDEDGNERPTGNKKYKVEIYVLGYHKVEESALFEVHPV